jgi:hypothetical protein
LIFNEDVRPDRDEFFERNGETKVFLYGLEKIWRRHPPFVEIIDHAFFAIEEIGEYFLGVLENSSLRKPGEFFGNLVVVERKDNIAQIKENDFDGRRIHSFPLTPPSPLWGERKSQGRISFW